MTINVNAAGGVAALNKADINALADALRLMGFGNFVRTMPVQRFAVGVSGAGVNPYVLAAPFSVTLPDDAKCGWLFAAYARSGTGTLGQLTVDNNVSEKFSGSAPAAGHVAVSPSGDVIFAAADAWTTVDLLYIPARYDIQELTLAVASNSLTLPANMPKVVNIFEVEATLGTSVGKKIIDVVGTAPAAGHAALALSKLTVAFQATDAVTQARVKFGTIAKIDIESFLESAQSLV